jgi:peptidoglycan hydrolase-like protein with peptidoglycan-binding domain
VRLIQRALQRWGFAPNVAGWVDGKFEQPTVNSVAAWQRAHMPNTQFFGQVWSDDWAKLLSR